MKLDNRVVAVKLATGQTVSRSDIKDLKSVLRELEVIIYDANKCKRQIQKAIRTA